MRRLGGEGLRAMLSPSFDPACMSLGQVDMQQARFARLPCIDRLDVIFEALDAYYKKALADLG
jgi:hypothetical protein